jgi:hypothetical protein
VLRARPPTSLPIVREMLMMTVASLPDSIDIAPGEIRVTFSDTTEALQMLYQLSLALHNDMDSFERTRQSSQISGYPARYLDIWDESHGNLLRYL